jgi:hypothetical protein
LKRLEDASQVGLAIAPIHDTGDRKKQNVGKTISIEAERDHLSETCQEQINARAHVIIDPRILPRNVRILMPSRRCRKNKHTSNGTSFTVAETNAKRPLILSTADAGRE